MPYPNYPDKYKAESVLNPQDILAYRRRLGSLPGVPPPAAILLCLQHGLPERLRRRFPLRRVGRLMGDLYLLKRSGGRVGVMANFGIGAPLMAALCEELIAWGARRLVSMTWAGGLQPDLRPGDIVVCNQAIRDEGTSHHYLPPGRQVQADDRLVAALVSALQEGGWACRTGVTWTTDAPYRETREEVLQYQAEGVQTVEMESAALLAVAKARGVQATTVCVVGDSLANLRWEAPPDTRVVERGLEAVYAAAIQVLSGE